MLSTARLAGRPHLRSAASGIGNEEIIFKSPWRKGGRGDTPAVRSSPFICDGTTSALERTESLHAWQAANYGKRCVMLSRLGLGGKLPRWV
jgi:hypothetical protein